MGDHIGKAEGKSTGSAEDRRVKYEEKEQRRRKLLSALFFREIKGSIGSINLKAAAIRDSILIPPNSVQLVVPLNMP